VIGLPGLALAISIWFQESLHATKEVKVTREQLPSEPEIDSAVARRRTVAIVGWIIGFFLAIWAVGFVPASALATFLYLKFGAYEKWPVTLALTIACWLFFYGLFDYALQLPFPRGTIFGWVHLEIPAVQSVWFS
jgi:tripartite tricarboxylate transporter TctB family protein